ncbi:STAS domain-containing protein [Mangrovihabitans endophyticus]|uniref:STAS domain-containing protein n=1 Tax=Mangrovihabitans endophyticus TaxID=1751298 RepID=UPI001E45BB29|nr:STAS domain-containing protein [Mangrovihabitans endophyticus]
MQVDDRPDAAVVHVRTDIDAGVAAVLRDTLTDAVDRRGHVVLDMAGVDTLAPDGLATLVRAHRRARQRGAWVCLSGPSRFVLTVLHTMKVDGVFPVFDDCAAALDWLHGEGG